MKQEYKEMQERLLPDKEKQEEMWMRVVKRSAEEKQKSRGKLLKTGVVGSAVAVVLICVLFLPQSGMADGIRKYILSQFTKKSDITEDIQKDIYTDQDEHVKMRVKEMLSDGTNVFVGICYTALDQEGKEWLAGLDSKEISGLIGGIVTGVPSEDGLEYSTGWGQNLTEQKKLATDTERHFIFSYFNDGDASVSASSYYTLQYAMSGGPKEFRISREANLDKILYGVGKNDATTERFDLRYLHVSKLSFQLLIQKNSKYDWNEWDGLDGGKIAFVMKDGSKKYADIQSQYTPGKDSELLKQVPGAEGEYTIISGQFTEREQHGAEAVLRTTIDNPDEIAAVEISGDQYDYGDGLYNLKREK